jgi:hypothetical protein
MTRPRFQRPNEIRGGSIRQCTVQEEAAQKEQIATAISTTFFTDFVIEPYPSKPMLLTPVTLLSSPNQPYYPYFPIPRSREARKL